tara:strand:+ start:2266 stop:2541 length:276 start_codon:yes stop_codon:yes gene_type:complete
MKKSFKNSFIYWIDKLDIMKKTIALLVLLTTIILKVSCVNENQKITVKEVRTAFDELFVAVDEKPNSFRELVTEDFIIFENSRRYNTDEFI